MAAPLPFSESELRLLETLLKHKVRFMVVGLSAATLQGAPVVTQDVDLWFEKLGEEKISRSMSMNCSLVFATISRETTAPQILTGYISVTE